MQCPVCGHTVICARCRGASAAKVATPNRRRASAKNGELGGQPQHKKLKPALSVEEIAKLFDKR